MSVTREDMAGCSVHLTGDETAPEKKPSILEKLQKTPTSEASVLKPGKPVRREALR